MLPKWYTFAVALCLVMMLSLVASAQPAWSSSDKYKLCAVSGKPCVVITMPPKGKCKSLWGYWVCNGRPRK